MKQGATLVYSYIGYVALERKAVAGVMNIILKEDAQALDEVVVVGYGVQKKSSVTGAISQVKSEDIQNRSITRAEEALQGKTAGVHWCLLLLSRVHHLLSVSVVSLPMEHLTPCM